MFWFDRIFCQHIVATSSNYLMWKKYVIFFYIVHNTCNAYSRLLRNKDNDYTKVLNLLLFLMLLHQRIKYDIYIIYVLELSLWQNPYNCKISNVSYSFFCQWNFLFIFYPNQIQIEHICNFERALLTQLVHKINKTS